MLHRPHGRPQAARLPEAPAVLQRAAQDFQLTTGGGVLGKQLLVGGQKA
jgi:hypothetical protein